MGLTGEWVPASAPLDEGYWRALLYDEEYGGTAPAAGQSPGGQDLAAPAEPQAVEECWLVACRAMERGDVLELPVMECNRGGVVVGWNGLRGFVPASHLLSLPPALDEEARYSELQRLIGSRLRLKVIEVEPEQRRLVLSERATRHDENNRRDLLNRLSPGDVCQGCVTKLCSFGAFVDLGGMEGLVHVSELSWGRVSTPADVLEVGQPVEVYVLNVDRERERVGLSLKRLHPDPWFSVEERYQVGQIIEGVITSVTDFGAFARVEEGLEGLIHVSELAEGIYLHPRDVVCEGDKVSARIISLDGERRRMGLSLRRDAETRRPGNRETG